MAIRLSTLQMFLTSMNQTHVLDREAMAALGLFLHQSTAAASLDEWH